MRLRQPAPTEQGPPPPATFVLEDWRDPRDPVRRAFDDAHLRAVRRWLDARLDHHHPREAQHQ